MAIQDGGPTLMSKRRKSTSSEMRKVAVSFLALPISINADFRVTYVSRLRGISKVYLPQFSGSRPEIRRKSVAAFAKTKSVSERVEDRQSQRKNNNRLAERRNAFICAYNDNKERVLELKRNAQSRMKPGRANDLLLLFFCWVVFVKQPCESCSLGARFAFGSVARAQHDKQDLFSFSLSVFLSSGEKQSVKGKEKIAIAQLIKNPLTKETTQEN